MNKSIGNPKRFTIGDKMATRDEILKLLEKKENGFVSGEEMAKELYLTRASVWKGIKALQKSGYPIEAVTNRGYRLVRKTPLLRESELKKLITADRKFDLVIYDEIGSTNDEALEYAKKNPGREAIFIANRQTKGRGRRGREFFSPGDTGLYMSFLLYPKVTFAEASTYTCMTAVALCEAISEALSVEAKIKWVNDIFFDDKKVAGILTEGIASVEDNCLSHVVIGAGINIYSPYGGFPGKLKDIAGFLLKESADEGVRERLCAAFVNRIFYWLSKPSLSFAREYKERSLLTGKYVRVESFTGEKAKYALVTGIDDELRLLVRYEDGHEAALSNGEVSVKKY